MINNWFTKNIYNTEQSLKKGKIKISSDDMSIPIYCDDMLKYNYNIKQLKMICKHYKLKQSGNKTMLICSIYNYLRLSKYAVIIQRNFRHYLLCKLNRLKGESLIYRKLSTNQEDFISLDPISNISPDNYFSFQCNQHNYGFHIKSLYNLVIKDDNPRNPYNRNNISNETIFSLNQSIKLSNLLKIPIDLEIDNQIIKTNKFKIIELFHKIDQLGNYSDYKWFYLLNREQLISFYKYLYDIWIYRVQLTPEKKCDICFPTGNPFMRSESSFLNNLSHDEIQKHLIQILTNLLTRAIDNDTQKIGAYYVLGALTLVNPHAANAIPWLYDSFMLI